MADWFGASWDTIGFVVASTTAMYVTMVLAVRVGGRRTVAQLSAFDVIVTLALGSLLAATAVSPDPSYAQATAAVVTLLVLQIGLAALRRRSPLLRRLLEFDPEVVVDNGERTLPTGLLSSLLSEGELESRLRQKGHVDVAELGVVVLEPSGKISVVPTYPTTS